jgi:4-amino-4-deoxy-L-arabinose transferase-like glycosyltransferase
MNRHRELLLAAAVSLAVHLPGLVAPPLDYHHHRQVNTAAVARNYARESRGILRPQIDWEGPRQEGGHAGTELPLYMWLMGLLWPLLGLGAVWGRVLSASFSALTAVYLYLFVERKLDRRTALWSALAFSFIPLEIYFGRTIQPEAMALLGTMAALYHWDRWLSKDGKSWDWAAAVTAAFVAIGLKLPYAYVLGPLALLAYGQGRLWTPAALAAAPLALGLALAWYKWAAAGSYVVPVNKAQFASLINHGPLWTYFQKTFLQRLPELAIGWAALPFWLLGVRHGWRSFFGSWWTFVALSLLAAGEYAYRHEYTGLPWAPVNAIFIGLGLARLLNKRRPWALALAAAVPLVAAYRVAHWYKQGFPFLAGAGAAAAAVSERGDLFVTNERAGSVVLYYLDRLGWSWSLEEAGPTRLGELDEKIAQGARFFATDKAALSGIYAERLQRHPLVWNDGGLLIYDLKGSSTHRKPRSRRAAASGRAFPPSGPAASGKKRKRS